jgi:hypothetical protein
VIAEKSAQAAKLAADTAKRTADAYITTERPWVALLQILPMRFENAIDENKQLHNGWQFVMEWINTGKTPAKTTAVYCAKNIIELDNDEPVFQWKTDESAEIRSGVVYPGLKFHTPPHQFVTAEIERLTQREARVFIYARVEYSDMLDEQPRHTEVCMEVRYDGVQQGNPRFVFGQATLHNSAA